jgi:hypothetical protein
VRFFGTVSSKLLIFPERRRAVLNNQTQNLQCRFQNISLVPTNESEQDRQSRSGRRGNVQLVFIRGEFKVDEGAAAAPDGRHVSEGWCFVNLRRKSGAS